METRSPIEPPRPPAPDMDDDKGTPPPALNASDYGADLPPAPPAPAPSPQAFDRQTNQAPTSQPPSATIPSESLQDDSSEAAKQSSDTLVEEPVESESLPPAPDPFAQEETVEEIIDDRRFGDVDKSIDLTATWPDEPIRLTENHVDPLFSWCVSQGSSDISLQSDRPVYNDIQGVLRPATKKVLDGADMAMFATKIYGPDALARLASGNDLDISYEIKHGRDSRQRFRINITAVLSKGRDAIQITMRSLPTEPPTMEMLGVEEDIIKNWAPRDGLVVVTGPTGSGKTTLLAAGNRMLIERDGGCGKMLTYEAPIEFTYDTVTSDNSLISQTEIPRHLKTFEQGIRNALRRKPNIIMVGEARDTETISAAIEAAQTGHAVYTTTHTTGVATTIRRMVGTFPANERDEKAYSLMETMRLICTQILVPKKSGGRVGLREWLVFDDDLREKLLDMHHDKWAVELMRLTPQLGQSMAQSAEIAFDRGDIDARTYKIVTKGASNR